MVSTCCTTTIRPGWLLVDGFSTCCRTNDDKAGVASGGFDLLQNDDKARWLLVGAADFLQNDDKVLAGGLRTTEVPPRVAQMCAFSASVVHAWIESYAVLLKLLAGSGDFVDLNFPERFFSLPYFSMADILVPQTPPRKVIKAKREANLTGLWEAWEENRQLRKYSRKKGSLLDWEHPSKVGLINRRSLMLNWKVILPLLEIYCPKHEPKTVPVQSLKQQVKRFFEEIEVAPKKGLVHCTSHSLKMFVSYILRRHDGSVRKDHRLKAIFDEVSKSWPAKLRSRRTLLEAEDEPGDDECEKEGQEEEEEEELQLTEDEVEDDSQAAEVDDYLAEDMGLCPGSPQPPSAYVGTVAYELGDEGPVPYQAGLLDRDEGEGGTDTDLVRRLAELEQQIAHRRAALSGQRAIERWHSTSV
ncbi:PU1 [Symbiodinium sp. CCMP2592]|nr:PU1 [Symbiodinium sp. CCMP2592]